MEEFYAELDRLYEKQKFDEIEAYLIRQSQVRASRSKSEEMLQMAAYNELASFYRNRGNAAEAVEYFHRAKRLAEMHCGRETAEYATIINNLAGAYRILGDYENALKYFETAMDIYSKILGTSNFYYTSAVNNAALLYLSAGELDKAEEMLAKALKVTEKAREMKMERAVSLGNLAVLYMKREKEDEAINALEEAVSIYGELPEDQRMHMAAACNSLGDIHLNRGKMEKADEMYRISREITVRFFGKNAEYAISCQKLAVTNLKMGKREAAGNYIDEAIRCMKRLELTETAAYREMLKINEISEG